MCLPCTYSGETQVQHKDNNRITYTTGNHVVLFTYKQVNDRVTHTTMRMNLTFDFRVFSYSVSSTD